MATDTLDFNPLHTLGFLRVDWIEAHCQVPGGVFEGEPLTFNGWQLFCSVNHHRIKPNAVVDPRRLLAPFHYRRSVIVGPQKCGKSPWGAGELLCDAVGPSLFAGWAEGGEQYRCEDHGCHCGWTYDYGPGEAMGLPRRKTLLALFAYAEDQTQNVYEPMQTMISSGPLSEFVFAREGFTRLPNRGMIVPLSSAMKSKLGKPFTGGLADESGLYTSQNKRLDTWQTLRRAIAAMQGRSIELTNPWDPMENSAAQQAFESRAKDIFRYYRKPPPDLSYANKRERHKIHVHVYADSPWVDPKGIDAEAAELVETDPTQSERFFGNRLVQGLGAFLTDELLLARRAPSPEIEHIGLGFDGSFSGDWTALRAETQCGHRFTPTYGPDNRPTVWNPNEWGGKIPRGEVKAAVAEIFARYKVKRMYVDPRHWETQLDEWALEHGDDVVLQWSTNHVSRMFAALDRYITDLTEAATTHDDCALFHIAALNARKIAKAGDRYILGKPAEHQKIDVLIADILAHEAASDCRAEGWSLAEAGPTYFRLPR